MPYIKELPCMDGVNKVAVVSPISDLEERKKMGWDTDSTAITGIEFLLSPSEDDVNTLLDGYISSGNTWCMFSGINAFPEVSQWFRMSLSRRVRRGIITEPPYLYEHPLWQHRLRFALQDWRYVKYIDKFFVMGDEFLDYYRFWSKRWDVIPFMYCTEWVERTHTVCTSPKLKLLYVGALSHRKNVKILIDALLLLPEEKRNSIEVGIVGDGDKAEELKKTVNDNALSNIKFYGSQSMSAIPDIMQQYDVLVLPSLHDGWGAVINESLTLGLYAICSTNCGAKYLLKDKQQGLVFESDNAMSLKTTLDYCVKNLTWIRKTVDDRISWARHNISGRNTARYFLSKL